MEITYLESAALLLTRCTTIQYFKGTLNKALCILVAEEAGLYKIVLLLTYFMVHIVSFEQRKERERKKETCRFTTGLLGQGEQLHD